MSTPNNGPVWSGSGTPSPAILVKVGPGELATRRSCLPDEQKATTVGFLARAVGWFNEPGITCRRILSNNGSGCRAAHWHKTCRALDLKPIRTKPFTPRTNGKAGRLSRTLMAEWGYAILSSTWPHCSLSDPMEK